MDFDVTSFTTTTISCPDPTALSASGLSSTGVNIAWTENGTASTWNIEWGATGFLPGTGAEIGADNGNTSQVANITGLAPSTAHHVYVQSDCGAGDLSAWVGPLSFTTSCVAAVAPYTETFSNAGLIPSCWTQGAANGEPWKFSNTTSGNHIGNNGVVTGASASGGYFAWVDDSSPNSSVLLY